jgi:S-adenosylmethionine-diacylglycerol 3-amino-3-carboxypropyl transferase
VKSEAASRADFSQIRYAQCWEDADILLQGLDIQPGDSCLSIASAGDNAFAMLSRSPSRLVALDLSPAQHACVELRAAAYRELTHPELLLLIGSNSGALDPPPDEDIASGGRSARSAMPAGSFIGPARAELYRRCSRLLCSETRAFWDAHPDEIALGIGGAGKFERYFKSFRERIVPLIHHRRTVEALLQGGPREARDQFYRERWNTWRWRLLFRIFFSRPVMARLGRDKAFFRYVKGSVAERILARTKHALTALNPMENPYLQWILTGQHTTALPFALRPENFEAIRANIDRLEWRCQSVEEFLEEAGPGAIDRANLSDIFEYMSEENYACLLERLADSGRSGGRLCYWNMLAPRSRPERLAHRLRPLTSIAERLHLQDKAFFYSAFIVEEFV